MRVSAIGLLTNARNALPKRATTENQADMHRYMIDEMISHIKMVREGILSLEDFADFYCIKPKDEKKASA